jgi:cobalt-zinc-cadmium efflux system membrane fusion protein
MNAEICARHSLIRRTLALGLGAALAMGAEGCGKAGVRVTPAPRDQAVLTQKQLRAMKIATALVDVHDLARPIRTTGRVVFEDQKLIHVFSPVAGRAVKVVAELGSHVRAGDPLAIIESPDVGSATADVSKAKADVLAATNDLRRQRELFAAHATSQKDVESAREKYETANAELERAEEKARLFRRSPVSSPNQRYTLRSELEGEVFMKALSPGMEIGGQYGGAAPFELFTVGRADEVWVLVDVFDVDVRRVKLGADVRVHVATSPDRTFEGKVEWISNALDPAAHVTRVRCTFANPDGALKPEMFAAVEIAADPMRAVAIPPSAVLRLAEQTVVFVDRGSEEENERFERVPVTVQEGEAGGWLPVERGLEPGTRIVTSGAILLSAMIL